MDIIEQQKEHFESISKRYFNARQNKNHLFLKKLMWNFFLHDKEMLKIKNIKVLEPMCGYAESKFILEEHLNIVIDYEGFDYSKYLVDIVNLKSKELNVYHQDILNFKTDKKYDLVIIIGGLHHVPFHVDLVTKNINSVLTDNGYFINLEPTQNNFIQRAIRNRIYKSNNLFDEKTEKAFDLVPYNELMKCAGFKIIDQLHVGLISHILYYNPDAFPYLSIGGKFMVKLFFKLDSFFFRNYIGKKFSFATLSLFQKSK